MEDKVEKVKVIKKPKSDEINIFDNVKPREYHGKSFPRTIKRNETWFIKSGVIDIIELDNDRKPLGKEPKSASTGSIIYFSTIKDEPTKIHINIIKPAEIKKIYTNEGDRKEIGTNIKINYMIIETVLKVLGKYDTAIISPEFIKQGMFEGAKQGDIYLKYTYCNEVDKQINRAHLSTGIAEDVFTGERRIFTGLRHRDVEAAKKNITSIKKVKKRPEIDNIITQLMDEDSIEDYEISYDLVLKDPLNYEYYSRKDNIGLSLKRLISLVIEDIKYQNEVESEKKTDIIFENSENDYKLYKRHLNKETNRDNKDLMMLLSIVIKSKKGRAKKQLQPKVCQVEYSKHFSNLIDGLSDNL